LLVKRSTEAISKRAAAAARAVRTDKKKIILSHTCHRPNVTESVQNGHGTFSSQSIVAKRQRSYSKLGWHVDSKCFGVCNGLVVTKAVTVKLECGHIGG